jgi:arsenate reductase-like glutaredoxin family protein
MSAVHGLSIEKILENPQVIKTPVVRNGKKSTLGYQPDVWKGWI